MTRALTMTRQELRAAAEKAGSDSPLRALVLGSDRAKARDLEHPEQVKLFAWRAENEIRIPALRLLYAIPNFSGRGKSKAQRLRDGARLKAEGRRKGMLDVCLPVARSGFHSLYLEIKVESSVSAEQRWWRDQLRAEGHRVEIVRGLWVIARDVILDYLEIPPQ